MATISLCMIVRDEESNLGECLRSVQGLVDEIVVVDTGSKDATVNVARSYTPNVYHFDWRDDFSAARNFSLSKASSDYVMWLDADDRFMEESVIPFLRLKKALSSKERKAFSFRVINELGASQESCLQIRLFPNLPHIRFEGRIHEDISPAISKAGFKVHAVDDVRILHKGYNDPEISRRKAERNYALLLKELEEGKRDKPTLYYFLGVTSDFLGNREEAKRYLAAFFNSDVWRRNPYVYVSGAVKLSKILAGMGRIDEAIEVLEAACERSPATHVPKIPLGKLYMMKGDYGKAMDTFVSIDPEKLDLVVVPVSKSKLECELYESMGDVYCRTGRKELSVPYYVKASSVSDDVESLLRIGKKLMDVSAFSEAFSAFSRASEMVSEGPLSSKILTLGALSLLSMGKRDDAERFLRKAIEFSPSNLAALDHLTDLMVEKGKIGEAKKLILSSLDTFTSKGERELTLLSKLVFVSLFSMDVDDAVSALNSIMREISPGERVSVGSFEEFSTYLRDLSRRLFRVAEKAGTYMKMASELLAEFSRTYSTLGR